MNPAANVRRDVRASAFVSFVLVSHAVAAAQEGVAPAPTASPSANEAGTPEHVEPSALPPVQAIELEATLDVAFEPFDAAAWERRLALVDLDRRERAVARLEALLPRSPDAQAWVRAQAQRSEGEVAWTCRMLLRSGMRPQIVSSVDAEHAEIFVWRGNDDRVLLGGAERASRIGGEHLDLFVAESLGGEMRRTEADVRRARRVASLADIVPLPPGAEPTELRFEIAIAGPADDSAPLGAWRVLETPEGGLQLFEPTRPDEIEHFVTIEAVGGDEHGARAGLFVLERRAPRTLEPSSVLEGRPFVASMERLGVYVDVEADGLVVLDVEPGSVAHSLGVARGDRLAAIDGVELARPEDITARLRAAAPTGSVALRWRRGGDGLVIERRYVAPRAPLVPSEPLAPAAPSDGPAAAPAPARPATKD